MVRTVAYTFDDNLLLIGLDDGTICVHDASSLSTNGTIRLVTVLGKVHRSYVIPSLLYLESIPILTLTVLPVKTEIATIVLIVLNGISIYVEISSGC